MRVMKYFAMAALALGVVGLGAFRAADEKPKYTTKEVMKLAHKEGLLKKVATGQASAEEKTQLVELYVALCQNAPKKGDKEAWVERCKKIVAAAKDCASDKKGAGKALTAAANCGACHKAHK